MTSIAVEFEFEIGEMLWMKGSYDQRGIVTDRFAQQCSGGIQLLYRLSRFSEMIPEIALTREAPEPCFNWKSRLQEKESNANTTDNT